MPDSDLAAAMYELADEELENAGYTQYEISNWSKAGYECQHNLTYWLNQPYVSCGPGAHSFEAGRRWWNVRPVPRYIELIRSLDQKAHPHPTMADFEEIDQPTAMGETMMLGLRLTQLGVSIPDLETRFGASPHQIYRHEINKLKTLNLLREEDQRLLLTPQARLLGNQVFINFL
jgi:oxygen-independent coproporphyrinogen-3 oxidase